MRLDITTVATPEQVLRALTDFSDRRLEIWRRTPDPRTYEVRGLGDTWAVARESTAGSPKLVSRLWVEALDRFARPELDARPDHQTPT